MEEFMNKMRSFNEMETNARFPQDPQKYIYQIEVNNEFKKVHLLKAYYIIENKFDEIISLQVDSRDENLLIQMTKHLLDRCLYDHTLKTIVYYAIMQSGNNTENTDTDESDTDESDTDESDTNEE